MEEKNIYNAKKYLELKIDDFDEEYYNIPPQPTSGTYIIFSNGQNNYRQVVKKNGTASYVVTVEGAEKDYWFATFASLPGGYIKGELNKQYHYLIVKPYFENDKKDFNEIAFQISNIFELGTWLQREGGLKVLKGYNFERRNDSF